MNRVIFPPKLTSETLDVSFDFTSSLAIGETIASGVVVSTVFQGEDATPEAIIDGTATLDGAQVIQSLTAGTAGVVYSLACSATTSASQVLVMQANLAIISSNPF